MKTGAIQILYPKYIAMIAVMSFIFFTFGVSMGVLLNKTLWKFDERKSKIQLYCEIMFQIILNVLCIYIIREYVVYFFRHILQIDFYGSPDKFAIFIVASGVYSQQWEMIKKIKYVWNNRSN